MSRIGPGEGEGCRRLASSGVIKGVRSGLPEKEKTENSAGRLAKLGNRPKKRGDEA